MAGERQANGAQTRRVDRPARGDGRVPPHNLQAEESVLGALLLSRDAIGQVSEQGLQPSDFYRPAHQHVYDAIRALYSSGAPVDTVTVADELRRAGLLDEIGGTEALHELQNATPAISSAGHYARIVQDTAMLRRLIYVAGDIAELAYGEPDDVTKAIDEAESKVFQIAEQRVTDSTRQLEELLAEAMDRLQETFDRGDTITGVATGYHDLDELLSGLQASALYIVGARPAMGKCVAWDTPMVDVGTGEVVTADEMMRRATERGGMEVRSLDADGRQVSASVSACLDDGYKPVFTVRTRSGRTVTITASHPLLTPRGWEPLEAIDVGEKIAVPTGLPVFGADEIPDEEIDLLALLIGDGQIGSAHTKHVPAAVFRSTQRCVARFLNRLFATDGTAWTAWRGYSRIGYSTVSERLAHDIRHLLLRFGIRSKLRQRHVAYEGTRRRAFEVEVMDSRSLILFAERIGILGKEAAVAEVARRVRSARLSWSSDAVPIEVWDDVMKAKGSLSWREVKTRANRPASQNWHPYRGTIRRETVAQLASALDDDRLRWWASPDVYWDEIVAIDAAGWTRVIDFTVPDGHNFVAADIYLHNTSFGLGLATHIAQHAQKPVLVFSLEMGHAELTQRILSSEARVDSTRIRTGRLAEADWAKIGKAIGRLEVPLFLDDNPRVTVMEIRAKARRIKARYGGLALIVIDYLQLMSGGGNPENRQLEVSEISRSLKILARELEVPIVALSQLSRNLETRADKRPMLSDLRESGSLEQDADVVMFLYRDEVYNAESPDKGSAEVIVAKHRSGPIGTKRLVFLGQYTRFDNAARGV
jgi:replicative DNA helicase